MIINCDFIGKSSKLAKTISFGFDRKCLVGWLFTCFPFFKPELTWAVTKTLVDKLYSYVGGSTQSFWGLAQTLQETNIAMENGPCIDDFTCKHGDFR